MLPRRRFYAMTALILFATLVIASASHPFTGVPTAAAASGSYSFDVAYDSAKGELFVTNYNTNSVSVISDVTNSIIATVPVGSHPVGAAYDSGKAEVFVTNTFDGTVSVISDTSNAVVATITVVPDVGSQGDPWTITYDSGKGELFVDDHGVSTISVISDSSNAVVATVSTAGQVNSLAYDPARGEVFASAYFGNDVFVISDTTNMVVATFSLGVSASFPVGVAYDSAKGEIFAVDSGEDAVVIVNDATYSVVATVSVGTFPGAIVYDAAKGEVFVANLKDNSTSVISDATNTVVAAVNVGANPNAIAYDSGKGELFVIAGYPYSAVPIVSDATNTVVGMVGTSSGGTSTAASSSTGSTTSTSFTQLTSCATVPNSTTTTCAPCYSIIGTTITTCTSYSFTYNTVSGQGGPGTVGVGANPSGLTYDPAKGEVFVTNFGDPSVSAISDATNTVVATVQVPGLNANTRTTPSPQGIAYDSAMGELFAANFYGNDVTVISDATNTVVATIDLGNDSMNQGRGAYPLMVAYDSAKGEIFVTAIGAETIIEGNSTASAGLVFVISDATNKVVATVPVGSFPNGIAYDPAKGDVFVTSEGRNPSDLSSANYDTGTVFVISDTTNKVVANVAVGALPRDIAYDPAKGELFVTTLGKSATPTSPAAAGSLSVISDATNAVVATVQVSGAAIAYDSARSELFVVNGDGCVPGSNFSSIGTVSVVSDTTNAVVATRPAGSCPGAIAYDPAKSELFVANPGNATVTIISDTTATSTSSTASSALAFEPSYLAIIAVNAALLLLLCGLASRRTKRVRSGR